MDKTVQRVEELTEKIISERHMKYQARAERDRAIRKAERLAAEISRLNRALAEARAPFDEEHNRLVETQLENIKLKWMIVELEEKHGLQKRDH